MFMMTSKTIIKSYAESGMSVEEVFTVANEKLCEGNETGMFVTVWMGILNTKTGKVLFANAGHNPPLVKHADGTYEYLKSRAGIVLAGMEGIRYRKNELHLQPGDAIYLYTDGVTEATDLNTELYGEERLYTVLEKYKDVTPEELCDEVKKDVDAFVGEAPQFDDITMLALKYHGEEDAQ
jgi:serine phosphatase RsbU (regulator of sigma subunit)